MMQNTKINGSENSIINSDTFTDGYTHANVVTIDGSSDFLIDGNTPSKYKDKDNSKSISKSKQLPPQDNLQDNYVKDCETMKAMELKDKYHLSYSAWRNMKQRIKTNGAIIEQSFIVFSSFLRCIGPRTKPNYTLDRIDPNNPTYGPDLVRWVDKKTQANNKGNTIFLTYKEERLSLAVWATKTKQKYNTLYKRHRLKWTSEEIITGERKSTTLTIWGVTPWPKGKEQAWESHYQNQILNGKLLPNIGKNLSREEFYLKLSKQKQLSLQSEIANLNNTIDYATHYSDSPLLIPNDLLEKSIYWDNHVKNAESLMNHKLQRTSFLTRKGGLGKQIEKALFDQITAINFNNMKKGEES
ncbi:MAG: hypothetical protein COA86_18340 [Kangiella sp.]|nr:MAG: hypothetical protein COA86_18340 [Kangiella sp.]